MELTSTPVTNKHVEGVLSTFMETFQELCRVHSRYKSISKPGYELAFYKYYDYNLKFLNNQIPFMDTKFLNRVDRMLSYVDQKNIILKKILPNKHMSEEFEIECPVMKNKIAVVKGFEVDRGEDVTCPVKALAVFISEKKIDFDEKIVQIFDDVRTPSDFQECYEKYERYMPRVYESNLWNFGHLVEKKAKCKDVNMVVFKNERNKLSEGVQPVCWMQFPKESVLKFKWRMEENCFFGAYVVVKLISGERTMHETRHDHNIDVQYVRLFGEVMECERSILREF